MSMSIQKVLLQKTTNIQNEYKTKFIESVTANQLLQALNILQNINNKNNTFEVIRQQENDTPNLNISFCQNSINFTSPSIQNNKNNSSNLKQNNKLSNKTNIPTNNKGKIKNSKTVKDQQYHHNNNNKNKNQNQNKMKFQFYMTKKNNINEQKSSSFSKSKNKNKNQKCNPNNSTLQNTTYRMSLTSRQDKLKLTKNKQIKIIKNQTNSNFNKSTGKLGTSLSPLSSRNTITIGNKSLYKYQRSSYEKKTNDKKIFDNENTGKKQRIKTQVDQEKKNPIFSELNINKANKVEKNLANKKQGNTSFQCSSSIQERTLQFLKNKNEKISKIQQAKRKQFEQNVQKQCTFKPKIIKNWKKPVLLTQRKKEVQQQFEQVSKVQSQQESLSRMDDTLGLINCNPAQISKPQNQQNSKPLKQKQKQNHVNTNINTNTFSKTIEVKEKQKSKTQNINKNIESNCYQQKKSSEIKDHRYQKQNIIRPNKQNKQNKKSQENNNQKELSQNSVRKYHNQKFNILLDLIH